MRTARLFLMITAASLIGLAGLAQERAKEPTLPPDIEGPWEFAARFGIDGVFFEFVPSHVNIWVYRRQEGKTWGGYWSDSALSVSDAGLTRLRIHFVHVTASDPNSFDLDLVFSLNDQHWTGTWSRDGQASHVVLKRPHSATGVAPSTFVGDWEDEADPNSRFSREPGGLHIAESSDGVLTVWLDRRDYGGGERLYVRSATRDALTLETTNGFGAVYRYQGTLSGDRQVLTGTWVMTGQPENRGNSLNAATRFRRKP